MPSPEPAPGPPDDDTLRIMLSTDNHLGYAEKDPVRGMDSFAAFEEVLFLAKQFRCDMVLLSGDLFHDNRPSRRTLHRTMEVLRRYCMGSDPVRIQILSDQQKNFRNISGTVNYQDENYSVDLPIFAIHGNHDDPSRDPGGDLLAALDILAVSNLVNYFGRHDEIEKVEVSPVLIEKGDTHVALYGMGSMRDERLNRMWRDKKVRFLRPAEDIDHEDEGFFNIFTLHQNRDFGRGKNCISETMIPEWMDLVVWGHEHECLIEFFESVVGTFRISQPGSSVATSLIAGEAVQKRVGILDIRGKQFRISPIPLTQVRGFVTSEISLREHRRQLDPEDSNIDKDITDLLMEEVKHMVSKAREKTQEVLEKAREANNFAGEENSPLKYKLAKPEQVLVRVRVEHTGFSSLNNQRFGAKFVGEVANPTELLLFHRRKEAKLAGTARAKKPLLKDPIVPDDNERASVETLLMEQLDAPEQRMVLLSKEDLGSALEDFVHKSISTISDTTTSILKKKQKDLIEQLNKETDGKEDKPSHIRELIEKETQIDEEKQPDDPKRDGKRSKSQDTRKKAPSPAESPDEELGKENSPEDERASDRKRSSGSGSGPRAEPPAAPSDPNRKAARRQHVLDDSEDDDMDAIDQSRASAAPARAKARPRRSATKRPNYSVHDFDDEEKASDAEEPEGDDDDLEIDDEPPVKKSRSTKATLASKKKAPAARAKSTVATKHSTKKYSHKKSRLADSSDEDGGGMAYAGSVELDDDWGTAATRSHI